MQMQSITFLNEMGDVTVVWDQKNDQEIPILPIYVKNKIKSTSQIKEIKVDVKDDDINRLRTIYYRFN